MSKKLPLVHLSYTLELIFTRDPGNFILLLVLQQDQVRVFLHAFLQLLITSTITIPTSKWSWPMKLVEKWKTKRPFF